jgi:pyrimidine-nucleoside phosphorylase
MAPLAPVEVIERRRRGEAIDADSVTAFMRGWLDGVAGDAQMAAWCMAAALEPARLEEVDALARVIIASGERLDLSSFGATGDCQSTGAVGDIAPLVALPLAAALGVRVAHIGAHSVGCLGGVLDTLAAIPGMRTDLSLGEFVACLRAAGCVVAAPGPARVSAAPRFDALRDATGTGSGVAPTLAPLMARAIAAGAGCLALSVPAGRGAAIADPDEARSAVELAELIAAPWGRAVRAEVSDADGPGGRAVGSGLEVREAGAVLRGEGDRATRARAVALAGALAEGAGVVPAGEGPDRAEQAVADGRALAAAERWVAAQGGDAAVWTTPGLIPEARVRRPVCAPRDGRVRDIDPRAVGEAARWAGAGRLHAAQVIDPAAGVELLVRAGEPVAADDPVMVIHSSDAWLAERADELLRRGLVFDDEAADPDA